jgi:inorganic pyrophosphatase
MNENNFYSHPDFWSGLDDLISEKGIFTDRPKGTRHPRFTEFVYPYDYGYVKNTRSVDGEELDVWIGEKGPRQVTGILNIIDRDKKDTEMKILYGCSPEEMLDIYRINNQLMMNAVLLIRER